ncbi:MAG TPA: type I-D CRISPR-associated protein Cas10d/Csc3, partial [Ktedonobacteraceae bacterium]|nr:type I-D CRISPR-associated protein Cas10d/Csc3 [Ktedonobacteraceae bacterium]
MPADIRFLKFTGDSEQDGDASVVFDDYLREIANKQLCRYKTIIQYGAKEGQSYYSHVMDLVTLAEKLRPALRLDEREMRCILLALTIHDLNKLPEYGKRDDGRDASYNDAATLENIRAELERLQADEFFPAWRDYLQDIVSLAHFHQEAATGSTRTLDQRVFDTCELRPARLKGVLKHLMKAVDAADNSHSGDHCDPHEVHLRDKLLQHINAAMPERQYRFCGHRLAELRGLFSNVLHNELVAYFREKYGAEACIDLQYYPEGANYLLDREIELAWTPETLREVATRIERKLAATQLNELAQFIKARPVGIVVDAAAIESGATTAQIFAVIASTVRRKQYKPDWRAERDSFARNDLQKALAHSLYSAELKEQVATLLEQADLIPGEETTLRRGEFASAYRKFLEDHRSDALKALKSDPWTRVYRLFKLPEDHDQLYRLIDPYRRGYFIARDLPALDLDEMEEAMLADIELLETQAAGAKTAGKPRKTKSDAADQTTEIQGEAGEPLETGYLVEYLKVSLEVWDSGNSSPDDSTLPRPVMPTDFGESLRLYADKRQYEQCCYCGVALKASQWKSVQVPKSISVQFFSNRLEAGSANDPSRRVCAVCRAQYILEKLAWRSHGDKYGAEQVTFYLHLFPYSFFTQPLLRAWWVSIDRLRDSEHSAFFIRPEDYFHHLKEVEEGIRGYPTSTNGLGLPTLSEALSNTPVLPIIAPGDNYGVQFMLALEMAVILGRWFECRAILSRLPIPPLNLSRERIDGKPVALMVEGMPLNMNWLVPATSMHREQV